MSPLLPGSLALQTLGQMRTVMRQCPLIEIKNLQLELLFHPLVYGKTGGSQWTQLDARAAPDAW
jgi:hypothetical protein